MQRILRELQRDVMPKVQQTDDERLAKMVGASKFLRKRIEYGPAVPGFTNNLPALHKVISEKEIIFLRDADAIMKDDLKGAIIHYNHEDVTVIERSTSTKIEGLVLVLDYDRPNRNRKSTISPLYLPDEQGGFILATPETEESALDIRKPPSKVAEDLVRLLPSRRENDGPEALYASRLREDVTKVYRTSKDPISWTATLGSGSAFSGVYVEERTDGTTRRWVITHVRHRELAQMLNDTIDGHLNSVDKENYGILVSSLCNSDPVKYHREIALRNARRIHALTAKAAGIVIPTQIDINALVADEREDVPELAIPEYKIPYNYITKGGAGGELEYPSWFVLNKTTHLKDAVGGLVLLTKPLHNIPIYPFSRKGSEGNESVRCSKHFPTGKNVWNKEHFYPEAVDSVGTVPISTGRVSSRRESKEISQTIKLEQQNKIYHQMKTIYVADKGMELQPPSAPLKKDEKPRRLYDSSYRDVTHGLENFFEKQGLDVNNKISVRPLIVKVSNFS